LAPLQNHIERSRDEWIAMSSRDKDQYERQATRDAARY